MILKNKLLQLGTLLVISIISIKYYLTIIDDNEILESENYELNVRIENLSNELIKVRNEIAECENTISNHEEHSLNKDEMFEQYNSNFRIELEIPYKFIQNTDYVKHIKSYREVNLGNGKIYEKARVEIKEPSEIIQFLVHVNDIYDTYYTIEITK